MLNATSVSRPDARPITVLASGGIDSTALIAFYRNCSESIRMLFIDYGQPAAVHERTSVRRVAGFYGIEHAELIVKGAEVPAAGPIAGRNGFLIHAALLWNKNRPGLIALGIHAGTSYWDCSRQFLVVMQSLVDGYALGAVGVDAPFIGFTKADVIDFSRAEHVPVELTYSCERGTEPPCGSCNSCLDRAPLDARV